MSMRACCCCIVKWRGGGWAVCALDAVWWVRSGVSMRVLRPSSPSLPPFPPPSTP